MIIGESSFTYTDEYDSYATKVEIELPPYSDSEPYVYIEQDPLYPDDTSTKDEILLEVDQVFELAKLVYDSLVAKGVRPNYKIEAL